MKRARTTPGSEREFLALCAAFPPLPIATPRRMALTQKVIDRMLDQHRPLKRAESQYLNLLGTLVHEYEERTVPIEPLDPAQLIQALLAERGLRQKDLVPVFRTESIASAVVRGKRPLTRRHVEELARFFHVSPAIFLGTDSNRRPRAA